MPKWRERLSERSQALVDWALLYVQKPFGDDGHNAKITIAAMSGLLDELSVQVDEQAARLAELEQRLKQRDLPYPTRIDGTFQYSVQNQWWIQDETGRIVTDEYIRAAKLDVTPEAMANLEDAVRKFVRRVDDPAAKPSN